MKISGFTIARNAIKLNYPILESIKSILSICDEFIVNVGDSDDDTLKIIESIKSDKIKIIKNAWDMSMGKEVLSYQTNLALKECKGDWAFYLQSDEVVHEKDLPHLKALMGKYLHTDIDVLRFKWFHFYGSSYRYRIDKGWYQKQDRIVRNNGKIRSMGDAWGFERIDGTPLKRLQSQCFIYHYGWVQPIQTMGERRINADKIGFISLSDIEKKNGYSYSNLDQFPVYFGSHPAVMESWIRAHQTSQEDLEKIHKKYWYHPFKIFRVRYKSIRRVKEALIK